jgi:putative transposase
MRKRHNSEFKAKVVQELLKEEKSLSQIASDHGVHPDQLRQWKAKALEGLPMLFERDGKAQQEKAAHEQQVQELYAEIGRLTTQVSWPKKNLASTLRREVRWALVERESSDLPLSVQCDLLGLNRTGLYYQPVPPSAEEVALKHRIDEIYTERPFYGSRKITAALRREGREVNRKAVQRHMREMGISAICPGPNLSRSNADHSVYPYLLRDRVVTRVNEVWGIDITYVRLEAGWMYLVAVLDWHSRYVVSWELDQTLELPFVLRAVERAFEGASPMILNSDQGSHFTSPQYLSRVEARGVQVSMDGKGRALDNIFTERLWRTVKYEEVYLHSYESPRAARQGLAQYLSFYNQERPHQALGYRTPQKVYSET